MKIFSITGCSHPPPRPAALELWQTGAPVDYGRHRPEQTALYHPVQQHAAPFIAETEAAAGAIGRLLALPIRGLHAALPG